MMTNPNIYKPTTKPGRPIVIMLIDDDADLLNLFKAQPPIADTLLVVKNGGFDALKYLHEMQYAVDVIITDLSMADIDGIRLTKLVRENEQLRGKSKPIDIYWLTGWPPNRTLDEAKDEFQVKALLEKPYDIAHLIEQVKDQVIHDTDEPNGMHLTMPPVSREQ